MPFIRRRTKRGGPAVSLSSARELMSERSLDLCSAVCSQLYGWHSASASPRSSCFSALPRISTDIATCRPGWNDTVREAKRLTTAERRIVVALIAVMIISIFESIAFGQIFNVSSIWIQQHVALNLGRFKIPVPWFQSVNSVFSILCVPLLFWIWRRQALRGSEPNELAKIGTGAWLAAASNLILVAAIFLSG